MAMFRHIRGCVCRGPRLAGLGLAVFVAVAAAVVQYLVQGFSLDPKRFRAAGYGEERLLEGIDADSPRHRRVEIVVFSPVPRNAPEPGDSPAPRAAGETPDTPGVPSTESAWPDAGGEPTRPQEGGSGVRVIN